MEWIPWSPATVEEVQEIVRSHLAGCDEEQLAAFRKYEVTPYIAPIFRYGKLEYAVVVARNEDEVMYWEDVEGGFNTSPVAPDGQILEHWCNQDKLCSALNAWIEGREPDGKFGPAKPLEPLE